MVLEVSTTFTEGGWTNQSKLQLHIPLAPAMTLLRIRLAEILVHMQNNVCVRISTATSFRMAKPKGPSVGDCFLKLQYYDIQHQGQL